MEELRRGKMVALVVAGPGVGGARIGTHDLIVLTNLKEVVLGSKFF